MNMNEIGIALLDIYTQEDYENCYNSIPDEYKNNLIVISDTNNKIKHTNIKRYGNGVQLATLRNFALSHFRVNGLKHFFLINSNQTIKDVNVFANTIKLAENFGIWFFTGPSDVKVPIEDEDKKLTLNLSTNINSDFIYIFNGIVSNVGYFDERFFNTKDLDVLDYIIRMREKNIYPPTNYISTIDNLVHSSNSKIQKQNYKEMENADQSVNLSYAYFMFKHKYIPTQGDPPPVSNDVLMKQLEEIQTKYAKK
jgi:hypothetical protein